MGIQVANVYIQEGLRWGAILAQMSGHTSMHEGATELIGGNSAANGNSALSTRIDGLEIQLEKEVGSTPDSMCRPIGNSGIGRTCMHSRGRAKRVQLLTPSKRDGR